MSRASIKYMPAPRILRSMNQVANYLGHGEQWFADRRADLERAGFPRRDDLLGGWDREAIDAWLDERSGLRAPGGEYNPCDDLLMGAA